MPARGSNAGPEVQRPVKWHHATDTTYYSRMAPVADAWAAHGWELVSALPKGSERVVLLFKTRTRKLNPTKPTTTS